MIIFLTAFLVVDALVIFAAHFSQVTEAALICNAVAPMCQYPVVLYVLGLIAGGILLLQR